VKKGFVVTNSKHVQVRVGNIRSFVDGWIEGQINMMAEPHPRKKERHMDRIRVGTMWRRFQGHVKVTAYTGIFDWDTGKFRNVVSTFYKRWNHRLNDTEDIIRMRCYKGVSSKCYACSKIDKLIAEAASQTLAKMWKEQKERHVDFYSRERNQQNCIILESLKNPKSLFVCADGIDGAKTVLPSYPYLQGALVGKYKFFLRNKLSAVHIPRWKPFFFRTSPWIKCGANLFLTTLHHCLCVHLSRFHGLPETLHILVDGGSENINATVFAYCVWLVSLNIFTDVYLYRLPVGHTHNLTDQLFSVIASYLAGLNGHQALTPEQFLTAIQAAYNEEINALETLASTGASTRAASLATPIVNPEASELYVTYDWKG
jgi:hypothetical protein